MLRVVADTFLESFKKIKVSNSLRVLDENKYFWRLKVKKIDSKDSEDNDDV
jgi:hypothetical protein